MRLILFGELRTEHLCIFLLFLVYAFFNLFYGLFTSFPDDSFVNIFSMFLGELFCVFIPITKYLNKSDISHSNNNSSEKNNKNINQINKIYASFIFSKEEFKEINPDFNMIIICLISFIDFR